MGQLADLDFSAKFADDDLEDDSDVDSDLDDELAWDWSEEQDIGTDLDGNPMAPSQIAFSSQLPMDVTSATSNHKHQRIDEAVVLCDHHPTAVRYVVISLQTMNNGHSTWVAMGALSILSSHLVLRLIEELHVGLLLMVVGCQQMIDC
jgi:hypothetical protein